MPDPSSPETVRVDLGARSYDILIGPNLISRAGAYLTPLVKRPRVFVMSDETVAALYFDKLVDGLKGSSISADLFTVPAGEASKSLTNLDAALDWLIGLGANRDDVLVALGGGVVGDLAGLTASLMKRGMKLVQIPTSLLAQVDSSVGGKTAINSRHGKNLIGAFYQPKLVLADTGALETLPIRERRAGYAEIVKYGLIDNPDFFDWLERHGDDVITLTPDAIAKAVAVSCQSKADIVAQDEREGGVRALLNLGHTFGHALEAANNYGPELLHGEAVACGMAMALRYSERTGLAADGTSARAASLLETGGLATRIAQLGGGPYPAPALLEAMTQDKKARAGRVPLILARGIGKSFIQPDADLSDVLAFLEEETSDL